MGYLSIDNVYKNSEILMFKECYALEKIHGTSAHVRWKDAKLGFFSGGAKHRQFVDMFDQRQLAKNFMEVVGHENCVVYGEAYGGKMQKMSDTYGPELRFIAFDVKIEDNWLAVPNANDVVTNLGMEFVYFEKGLATVEFINQQRDAPSVQAVRNGMGEDKKREGVVIRPLVELTKNNGKRIIAKHKRDDFRETRTPREISPAKLKVLNEAKEISEEWVTRMRLLHVLDKLQPDGSTLTLKETGQVVSAMIQDVRREGEGEIVWSKDASRAIGRKAAMLFKAYLQAELNKA